MTKVRKRKFLSIKSVFIKLGKSLFRQIKSSFFWICVLTIGSLLLVFLLLWPNNRKISSPVIVASSDSHTLIPLRIIVLNDHDLKLQFSLHKFFDSTWTNIAIQKAPGATDFRLTINNKSTDSIQEKIRSRIFIQGEDNYVHIEKDSIDSIFDFTKENEFYFEYTINGGLYKRDYSSFFVSLIYMPVTTNFKIDDSLPKTVDVELQTPHNYIVTSSIPDAQKIFVIENGVYYTYQFVRKETGILINIENLSDAATKEIIMLFLSTIFGFALGFWLEKWFEEKKKTRTKIKEAGVFKTASDK